MSRSRLIPAAGALLLTLWLAGPAAATTLSLIWTGRNGSPITETADLDAVVGDTAQLELRVVVDAAGLNIISQSFSFDTTRLDVNAVEICPAGLGNEAAGSCGLTSLGEVLTPFPSSIVPTIDEPAGEVRYITAAASPGPNGQSGGTFTLARVDFAITADGFSDVTPFFDPGIDGAGDLSNNFFFQDTTGATVSAIIPEPGTGLLFAFGIGLLAARRWRD